MAITNALHHTLALSSTCAATAYENLAIVRVADKVCPVMSRVMLAVLHSHAFDKASQVAAYLGLVPKIQESGLCTNPHF